MSMFPSPIMPGDPQRSWRDAYEEGVRPHSLRITWVLSILAAALMLVMAVIMLSTGFVGGDDAPLDVVVAFEKNQRIVAWGNIVLAVGLGVSVSRMLVPTKRSRQLFSACVAAALFLNVAGFIVTVAGYAAIIIVSLLAFAVLFAFRPASTAYIRYEHSE